MRRLVLIATVILGMLGVYLPARAQVIGIVPYPQAIYYWDVPSVSWKPCPNNTPNEPSENLPQPVDFQGFNAGLGQWTPYTFCPGQSTGGLASFTSGPLPPIFTTSLGSDPTHNPALTFTMDATPNASFLGNFSGSSAPWAKWTLAAGSNVTFGVNTGTNTLTINATGGGGTGCITSGITGQAQGADGSGNCIPITAQVNSVNLTTQTLPNFVDGTNTHVTNPGTNQVRIDVTTTPLAIRAALTAVPPGQGIFIPFGHCTFSTTNGLLVLTPPTSCSNAGGIIATTPGSIFNHNTSGTIQWDTPVPPAGLVLANITAIYAITQTGATLPSPGATSFNCTGTGFISQDPFIQQSTLTSLTGGTLSGGSCSISYTQSTLGAFIDATQQLVGLWAQYTGPAVTQDTILNIGPHLWLDTTTNTLETAINWPNGLYPLTVAEINAQYPASPTQNLGFGYPAFVASDLANLTPGALCVGTGTPSDATTGSCRSDGTNYFVWSQAGVEAAGLSGGNLGSIPFQTSPNLTAFVPSPVTPGHTYAMGWLPVTQPQVVQSGSGNVNVKLPSPVTSGDALFIAGFDSRSPPAGCGFTDTLGTTFTLEQTGIGPNVYVNTYVGKLTASGVDTISASSSDANFCTVLVAEVSGINASTIIDVAGTVAGTTSGSFGASATTTVANDLLLSWEGAVGGTSTVGIDGSPRYLTGSGLGPTALPFNLWSEPAATATTYSHTFTNTPSGQVIVGGLIAFKAGPGGPIAPVAIDLASVVTGVGSITPGTNITCTPLVSGTCVGAVTINATGGGSVSLTSPTSTLTLSPATITGTGTLDINLARPNTWTGKQTQPAPLFSNLAGGGNQCLTVDNLGQVSGTGLACGTGGGTGMSGMTAGQVPLAATATTVTSSKAIQGTDTNLLSSGTISGLGSPLCTDANGGATTVSCPGGGGSSTVASAEVVSFSSTPTFSTAFNVSRIVLTGNITTFTLGAGSDGQSKTLCFKQGAGPFTVAGPANVDGFFTVGTINALWSCQSYVYDLTDSIWQAVSLGVINE